MSKINMRENQLFLQLRWGSAQLCIHFVLQDRLKFISSLILFSYRFFPKFLVTSDKAADNWSNIMLSWTFLVVWQFVCNEFVGRQHNLDWCVKEDMAEPIMMGVLETVNAFDIVIPFINTNNRTTTGAHRTTSSPSRRQWHGIGIVCRLELKSSSMFVLLSWCLCWLKFTIFRRHCSVRLYERSDVLDV